MVSKRVEDMTRRDLFIVAALIGGKAYVSAEFIREQIQQAGLGLTAEEFDTTFTNIMRAEARGLVEYVKEIERQSDV